MQNRIVVLAALDKANPNFEAAKKELKATALEWLDVRAAEEKAERQDQRDKKAKQVAEAEAKGNKKAIEKAKNIQVVLKPKQDVGFAWVDGVFWDRWLQTTYGIHVKQLGMQVVVNEQDKHRYWDTTTSGGPIEIVKATIIDTIQVILSSPNKIKPKIMKNRFETAIYAAQDIYHNHPLLTLVLLFAIFSLLIAFYKGKLATLQANLATFLATPPKGKSGANGGLLGGATTGKFD
ncbi:hypothetical protein NEOLI_005170 [Neolecta irregularis DAH-3]|uniref:Uncharacterized protein n=1 Tax=Neolecta irregularis (strain DAH-3) TaxID=1198029 RepID=A0A1U7LRS4_NEOID|nr:hypothetical protein NEOLI_005170 [Neolecta irregularis DAH-3]|eukprot:OLL25283.1 hypothetical protein NEOLI_005170 [Neolecta irregularis DAH-3]